jgi:hypothetical protein
LRQEFCSRDEKNPSKNFEQAKEVEPIEKVLTDNQTCFSYESLYTQFLTIMEEDLMLGQGECPYSLNSCSNQYLNSLIEEYLDEENNLNYSNIPKKLIRDVNMQLEKETLNLHPQTVLYP